MHYLQTQNQGYTQPQSNTTYSTWPSTVDYSGMTAPSTTPWSQSSYHSTYPMYENESTNAYASHPPSYMLPDPDHGARHSISYMSSLSRPQQNSLWLDQMNSASVPQQASPVYPLTPAESTKSYAILGVQSAQHTLSSERTLPQPTLSGIASLPSNGHETPPLSAVSHRSSHTWNTDTASHVSNVSSRTSCGDSHDLSTATQGLTTCEDQATIYPYPADSTSPVIDLSAAVFSVATDDTQHQQLPQITSTVSDTGALELQHRTSQDSLRAMSPVEGLYGYSNTISTHRPHNILNTRLLTSGYPSTWNTSPTSSRNNSLGSQQATEEIDQPKQFPRHRGSTSSHNEAQNQNY